MPLAVIVLPHAPIVVSDTRDEKVHAFVLSIFGDHGSLGPPACRKMLTSRIEAVGSEIALHGLKAVSGDSLADAEHRDRFGVAEEG